MWYIPDHKMRDIKRGTSPIKARLPMLDDFCKSMHSSRGLALVEVEEHDDNIKLVIGSTRSRNSSIYMAANSFLNNCKEVGNRVGMVNLDIDLPEDRRIRIPCHCFTIFGNAETALNLISKSLSLKEEH